MNDFPAKFRGPHAFALLWAAVAVVMAVVVTWAAMQVGDPLSNYIHTDKVRHILAFGAIGVCAAFMPSARLRIIALAAVLTFGMLVEIIQIPIPYRTASLSDLFASLVGGLAGFGLGVAATTVLDLARGVSQPERSPRRLPWL
jgi:VanZ family protein